MAPVRRLNHPSVIVGSETGDDAGVVRLTDDIALVQTLDFFPPMVDDPRGFGRVGAANSLSDVYAMGGRAISAVCVYALPAKLPAWVPSEILNGAVDVLEEAGAPLVGGHTVRDEEIKFGLAVTGVVHPDKVVTNAGAKAGDVLVLTKPLGSGYLCTALKRGVLDAPEIDAVMDVMGTLNKAAAEAMNETGAHAATDITGFGLIGHALGIAEASGVTVRLRAAEAPWMDGLEGHISTANTCGGLKRNRAYGAEKTLWQGGTETQQAVLADPQTSGGLLISVAPDRLDDLLAGLRARDVGTRAIVGEVVARTDHVVEVV